MTLDSSHIAFLRAINVRGHKTIAMQDLTRAFDAAGCTGVRSVIQSGNVLFTPPEGDKRSTLKSLHDRLERQIGHELVIFYRRIAEIERLVRQDPFKAYGTDRKLKLYVAFLSERLRGRLTLPLISAKERLEAIAIKNCEAFIVSRRKPNGFYGFPNNFIEDVLGVRATTRNWSTILKIASMARDDS